MIYTLYGFALFFFIFWCAMWLVHLIAIVYGKYRLHRKLNSIPTDEPFPGVSILKPLMGVDPHLVSNLETFFTMTYPMYEIFFCIEDEKDPSLDVVNALIEKYPKVKSNIFIGGSTVGVNPKINNMNKAYESTTYELILISDSGIRMKEDTLQDMVEHLTEKTGIVHQMPFTSDRNGFAAVLEKVSFEVSNYDVLDILRSPELCHTLETKILSLPD